VLQVILKARKFLIATICGVALSCLFSCVASYANSTSYEPLESKDNPGKVPFDIDSYKTRDFSLLGFPFTPFLFMPLPPDDGPYDETKKSLRLNAEGPECPIIYINEEQTIRTIWKKNEKLFEYNCEYGRLPIPKQLEYKMEYRGSTYKITFKKSTFSGYTPFIVL
jgi:hypothetical protein